MSDEDDLPERPKPWRSMDDLPNIDPKRREWFSVLLAEILCPGVGDHENHACTRNHAYPVSTHGY
jgi:hypothetical protein